MRARISTFFNAYHAFGTVQYIPFRFGRYSFFLPLTHYDSFKSGCKLELNIKNLNLLVKQGAESHIVTELRVKIKKIDWFLQWNSYENNSRKPIFLFGINTEVGFSVGNDKNVKSIGKKVGKKIGEVVNSENSMKKLNLLSEERLLPNYTFSASKLISSATENIDLFFVIGFLLLFVKAFYKSYQKNDGLNDEENDGAKSQEKFLNLWNQKVPLKMLDFDLNEKPKKFRKRYLIPTVLLSSFFLENIYRKQKDTANLQSKEEITQDFLIFRNLLNDRLSEHAITLITIASNKYVWIVIYKCISFVDSNFKIGLVIKRIWLTHFKYTNSTISRLFCALCLYIVYRIIFSINKKVVKVIIKTYENIVNISTQRIFLWCN